MIAKVVPQGPSPERGRPNETVLDQNGRTPAGSSYGDQRSLLSGPGPGANVLEADTPEFFDRRGQLREDAPTEDPVLAGISSVEGARPAGSVGEVVTIEQSPDERAILHRAGR
jgi:hypothetical protein